MNKSLEDKIVSLKSVRVLVLDDHESVLKGVADFLNESITDVRVYTFNKAEEALEYMKLQPCDIYIVDLQLGDYDGIDIINELRAIDPNCRIVVHSVNETLWNIKSLLKKDVNSIVMKSSSLQELLMAINDVMAGEKYYCKRYYEIISPDSKDKDVLFLLDYRMSVTEVAIIQLIAKSYTSQQIADVTGHKKYAIESYRRDLFRKFKVNSAAELVAIAMKNGFPIDKKFIDF